MERLKSDIDITYLMSADSISRTFEKAGGPTDTRLRPSGMHGGNTTGTKWRT